MDNLSPQYDLFTEEDMETEIEPLNTALLFQDSPAMDNLGSQCHSSEQHYVNPNIPFEAYGIFNMYPPRTSLHAGSISIPDSSLEASSSQYSPAQTIAWTPSSFSQTGASPSSQFSCLGSPLAADTSWSPLVNGLSCGQAGPVALSEPPTSPLWNTIPKQKTYAKAPSRHTRSKKTKSLGQLTRKEQRKLDLPEKCIFCGKGHADYKALQRHYISNHKQQASSVLGIDTSRIPCPQPGCKKNFARSDGMTRHRKSKH